MFKKLKRKITCFLGVRLGVIMYGFRRIIATKTLPRFANQPQDIFIDLPRQFANPDRITIGNNVLLGPSTSLLAITHYPSILMRRHKDDPPLQTFEPRIVIGNHVSATANLLVAAVEEVVIEDYVMFASNVHVNDSLHGYDNTNQPYKYQPLGRIAPIRIKQGCWIGQNVVILPGVTIGEQTIVGANSLVNDDLPARCIAVGSPAKIIKRWSQKKQGWVAVET